MSHPGMTPVVTGVIERSPGDYEALMQFSMAGDWVLVLTGELPGGGRFTRQLDVPLQARALHASLVHVTVFPPAHWPWLLQLSP